MNLKVFFLNNTLKILVYVRIKVIFYLDHVKKVDFQKRNKYIKETQTLI